MSFIDILVVVSLILWILASGGMLFLLLMSVPLLRRAASRMDRAEAVFELVQRRLDPLLERADRVVDDARYLSTILREDVGTVSRSVNRAAASVDRMVDMAEERATELNGLLQVVQEETEEAFLSTASLLRALRGLGRRGLLRDARARRRLG